MTAIVSLFLSNSRHASVKTANVSVELGEEACVPDPSDAHSVSRSFPLMASHFFISHPVKASTFTGEKRQRRCGISTIGKPSIQLTAVDLSGKPYGMLLENAEKLLMADIYPNPRPLQFTGAGGDSKPVSLCAEDKDYMGMINELQAYLDKVKIKVKPGCSQEVLKAALSSMASVLQVLSLIASPGSNHLMVL